MERPVKIQSIQFSHVYPSSRLSDYSLVVQSSKFLRPVYTLTDFDTLLICGKISLRQQKFEKKFYQSCKVSISVENGWLRVKEDPVRGLFAIIKKNNLVKGTRFSKRKRADGVLIEFRYQCPQASHYCAVLIVEAELDDMEKVPIIAHLPWRSTPLEN